MGFDSGSDRIAFEEQPAGAVGPPGPLARRHAIRERHDRHGGVGGTGCAPRRIWQRRACAGAAEGDGEGVLGLYGAAVNSAGTAQIYKSGRAFCGGIAYRGLCIGQALGMLCCIVPFRAEIDQSHRLQQMALWLILMWVPRRKP